LSNILRIPLHVSGIWIPVITGDLKTTGSIGAGVNLDLYLEVVDYTLGNECSMVVNDKNMFNDHAEYICGKTGVRINARMHSPVEPGSGFAVSAASTLAYSILYGFVLKKGFIEDYAAYAHEAEVLYKTGLGDVSAIYHGGLEVRVKPGAPGVGVVKRIVMGFKPCILACILPGFEDTPSMLSRLNRDVYAYGERLLKELIEEPSIESFFEKAQLFTRRVFDYALIDRVIAGLRGYILGFYRKKQSLIVWVERDRSIDVMDNIVRNLNVKCFETTINQTGLINA